MIIRIGLFTVAALLLGAHFLRAGHFLLVALCLLMPLLFLVRKRWVLMLLQCWAYFAAVIWIIQTVHLVELRQLAGQPWFLAAAILAAVSIFTILSGLLLNSRTIRERYDSIGAASPIYRR